MNGYLSNSQACLRAGNYAVCFGSRISDIGDSSVLYKLPSPQPERSLHFQLKFIDNFSVKASAEKAPLLWHISAKLALCSLPIPDPENPLTTSTMGKKSALSAL